MVKAPRLLSKRKQISWDLIRQCISFYVRDLVSKSLLYDGIIALFGGETKPYTNLRIIPFGEGFLGFIEGFPAQ